MDRRNTILDAAHALLLHYGTRKTTMADIADRAGIAVGSLYLEFRSKESVLLAASSRAYTCVVHAMGQAAASARRRGHDAGAELRAAQLARLEAFEGAQAEGRHALELLHCTKRAILTARAEFHAAEAQLIASILEHGVATGVFGPMDTTVRAQSIVRATTSFMPPWGEGVSRAALVPMLEDMLAMITHGLTYRP